VYWSQIENEEDFYQLIFYACQSIRWLPGTFASVRQSMIEYVNAFIDLGGGHFEHLLWIVTLTDNKNCTVTKLGNVCDECIMSVVSNDFTAVF